MIVLVTGGTGLIGKSLQKALGESNIKTEKWHFVGSEQADLRDAQQAQALFKRVKPTHVIHLAGKTGSLYYNKKYPVDIYRDLTRINDNVFECSKAYDARLVSLLPSSAYAEGSYPKGEADLQNGTCHPAYLGQSYATRMVDVLNKYYNKDFGCRFTAVIATNVYGPCGKFESGDDPVVPSLIAKCHSAKVADTDFCVLGSGHARRQFIYSLDIAKLIIWFIMCYEENDPLVITLDKDQETDISHLSRLVAKVVGFKGNIIYRPSESDGALSKTLNNERFRSLRPTFQFTSLEEGLRCTYKHFLESKVHE